MAVSDARRLKVYEQARAHWGEKTAEVLMELVVLHDDKDFALIAGITGQPHERLR